MTKTLREMMNVVDEQEQLDEGWKSALAGAAAAGALAFGAAPAGTFTPHNVAQNVPGISAMAQAKEKKVPDDKVAYYLLGEYEAISHLSDYIPQMKPWEAELKPYVEDIWARREAGDLPDEYNQAYEDGFHNTERFIKSNQSAGFNEGDIGKTWASHWQPRHDKLVLRLNQKNESVESTLSESIDAAIAQIKKLLK